jgi:hypothetical protein
LTKYTPKSSTHLILPETHLKHGYIRLENRPYAEVSSSKNLRYHDCFGAITYESGTKYFGEWKYNKRHGQGTITIVDGTKYVGEWKNGKSDGEGTLTYANGDKYIGEFKNHKENGQGTITYANGTKYFGEWKDKKRHGQGTITFGPRSEWAGYKYVGEWKKGKPTKGTGIYPDGSVYIGQIKNSKRHGQGVYTESNGTIKEGVWKQDIFQYEKKTPYSKKTEKPLSLESEFNKLSKKQREQLQSNLKKLDFYQLSIDGSFGNGTASALVAYNKKHLGNSNLKKSKNVDKLFNKILMK